MPAAPNLALQKAAPSHVQTVRWGHHWGWGVGGGFVAGAIVGSALAAPYYYAPGYYPYYYGPGPYYPAGPAYYGGPAAPAGDAVSYCAHRFHSYDPRTGTYLGLDGVRHPCP
jgi:hypothetical protein